MDTIKTHAAFAEQYLSASFAGTGNNHCLRGNVPRARGRIAYPITHEGTFPFAFLFQNKVDSTFDAGQESHGDLSGGVWRIGGALVGVSKDPPPPFPRRLPLRARRKRRSCPTRSSPRTR